jgi:hypothetical protein
MQGLIGNCWIIAPISAAASLIEKEVFRPNKAGRLEYRKGEQQVNTAAETLCIVIPPS